MTMAMEPWRDPNPEIWIPAVAYDDQGYAFPIGIRGSERVDWWLLGIGREDICIPAHYRHEVRATAAHEPRGKK